MFIHKETHARTHTQIQLFSDNRSLSNDFAKNVPFFLTLKMYEFVYTETHEKSETHECVSLSLVLIQEYSCCPHDEYDYDKEW